MSRIFALASVVFLGTTLAVPSFADGGKLWVATWATSPASFFAYTAPPVPVYPPGAPTTFAPATIQPDLVFPFPDAATTGNGRLARSPRTRHRGRRGRGRCFERFRPSLDGLDGAFGRP